MGILDGRKRLVKATVHGIGALIRERPDLAIAVLGGILLILALILASGHPIVIAPGSEFHYQR